MLPDLHLGLPHAEEVQTQHDTVILPLREEPEEGLSPAPAASHIQGIIQIFFIYLKKTVNVRKSKI